MKTTRAWIIIVLMLVFLGGKAFAYCIITSGGGCPQSGTGWPGAAATFHSNGFVGSESKFDNAFVDALNSWNGLSNFSYSSINDTVDPCAGEPDSTRGWKFDSTVCGTPFQSGTLAVATTWASSFSPSINNIIDSDITFNTAKPWDVHNSSGPNFDFRRVAVHELGHALGLGHETTNTAIMDPFYSQTIKTPQPDDINGLCALYGGIACAPPSPDIKANGADGPVTPTGNLSVTVALDSGGSSGTPADWWVAANVSDTSIIDGWWYYNLSTSRFVHVGNSPSNLVVTHQGNLSNLATYPILDNISVSDLPSGTYTFYFAVDMNKNGLLDLDVFFDSVVVNIIIP